MKAPETAQRLEALRRRLAAVQIELALCLEDLLELADADSRPQATTRIPGRVDSQTQTHNPRAPAPVVDPSTFTILWNGKTCHLGCGVPFRIFERLAKRPNQYASYNTLIQDVWLGAPRSDETLRSEVRRVRVLLRAAGMPELAAAMKGRNRHYGLILHTLL